MENLNLFKSLAVLALGLLVLRTVYHLYFHPLSKFPGPRLAAATFLYEFYYDVWKGGMYIWEVERMHEKYGQYSLWGSSSSILQFPESSTYSQRRPNRPHQPQRAPHQRSLLL